MTIQAPTAGRPPRTIERNTDGTIDYYERITLETPPTAKSAIAGSPPPRQANRVLAAIQLLVGYAWLVSGVDKWLYGSFPDQLGQLTARAVASGRLPDVFTQFLQATVLPNAPLFGVLVESGETLTGMGLLAGAVVTLAGPMVARSANGTAPRLPLTFFRLLAPLTMGAALGGLFMGLNFYMLDGLPIPWFTPGLAYGGAIHSGLLLALICLIIFVAQITGRVRLPTR